EGSTAPDNREVAMSISEYEERFRPPAASLYQTLIVASGRNAGRRRRRIWVVAAAIGVLAITSGAASHHAVNGWANSHSRTTAFYGQRMAAAVSDEFSVSPCWKAASSANETAGDPGRFAVFLQQSGSLPIPAAKHQNGRLMTGRINTLWQLRDARAVASG